MRPGVEIEVEAGDDFAIAQQLEQAGVSVPGIELRYLADKLAGTPEPGPRMRGVGE